MKTRLWAINFMVMLRATLVLVISVAACFAGAAVVREQLDQLYRKTNGIVAYEIFYWLSENRYLVGGFICVLALVLLSGWILRPSFNQYARFIKKNIHFGDESGAPIVLPKELHTLETELNDINKELRLWKYAAKEAEQRKDDLVVYLAHDIRTPLTSVLGYLELLDDNPGLSEAQRSKFVSVALRKAKRMQLLVEELFEVTRFNISQIDLQKEPVNASVLVNQLAEELEPVLDAREVTIQVVNEGLQQVFIDPDKMARALDNILNNAVHYTPSGGAITVKLDKIELDSHMYARFQISNTGMALSQQTLDRFFEKFYRGDEARQSGTGGSGLGLAIAKNIVEAHGGSISAQNQNKTTTFTILLPDS